MKKILLFTHNLNYEGAPYVIYQLAELLIKNGYQVTVISFAMGALYDKFTECGAKVRIAIDDTYYRKFLLKEIITYDAAIINTIVLYQVLDELKNYIPAIWYIHEAKGMFEVLGYENEIFKNLITAYDNIVIASEHAKKYIETRYPVEKNRKITVIHNYCEDLSYLKSPKKDLNKPVNISVVGTICEVKNQIGLVNAYKKLPDEYKNKCVLHFAGQNGLLQYFSEFSLLIKDEKNIIYHGIISGKDKENFFKNTDVICIPSLDECHPLIALEALSSSKPLIISKNTGCTIYCNSDNSVIVDPENTEELKNALIYIIDNEAKLESMGIASRKAFEKYISKEQFEKSWLNVIENIKTLSNNPAPSICDTNCNLIGLIFSVLIKLIKSFFACVKYKIFYFILRKERHKLKAKNKKYDIAGYFLILKHILKCS